MPWCSSDLLSAGGVELSTDEDYAIIVASSGRPSGALFEVPLAPRV